MANLVDMEHPGLAGRSLSIGGRALALADPLLVREPRSTRNRDSITVG